MDNLPFILFIIPSLPESFIIFTLGLTVLGIDPIPILRRIIFAAVLTTILSYVIRSIPILFGTHTVIQFVAMVILASILFNLKIYRAVIVIIIGLIAFGLTESITFTIIALIIDIPIGNILADPWLRIASAMPHIILWCIVLWVITKNNLYSSFFKKIELAYSTINKATTLIFSIALLQALLLIVAYIVFFAGYSGFYTTLDDNTMIVITFIIILSSAIVTIIIAVMVLQVGRKEAQLDAEFLHLEGLQNIYLSIRQQQHDYINHVSSLYGLINSGKITAAKDYITKLNKNIARSRTLLDIKIPALSGLLELKSLQAEKRGIEFDLSIDSDFYLIPVKPVDLTGIVGNLIDNALDAAKPVPSCKSSVSVELLCEGNNYIIAVENTGIKLSELNSDKIFNAGFTTKNKMKHTGLGLYTVSKIVDLYNGQIKINEPVSCQGVRFEVLIPQKGGSK